MTSGNTRVIIMGATNRPKDVDAAILRRMPAMFHVGLPVRGKISVVLEKFVMVLYLCCARIKAPC